MSLEEAGLNQRIYGRIFWVAETAEGEESQKQVNADTEENWDVNENQELSRKLKSETIRSSSFALPRRVASTSTEAGLWMV